MRIDASAHGCQSMDIELEGDKIRIFVGTGLDRRFIDWLIGENPDKVLVVTDDAVNSMHGDALLGSITPHFPVKVISMESGEDSKCMPVLERLLEDASEFGLTKNTYVVSLGGGVVGNVAGMVAGLLFRGLPLVHIPTTVLAQVDASISRKQAVNGKRGKNIFGLWKSPKAIFVDFKFLETLDRRQIKTGLAEAIKLGLIADLDFFSRFEELSLEDVIGNRALLEDLIREALIHTCRILENDPSEGTSGLSLEIGHTVGHAIEILMKGKLSHGEAISIGLMVESGLSVRRALLGNRWRERIRNVLTRFELPVSIPECLSPRLIYDALKYDNKRRSDEVTFIPIRNFGTLEYAAARGRETLFDVDDLRQAIEDADAGGQAIRNREAVA